MSRIYDATKRYAMMGAGSVQIAAPDATPARLADGWMPHFRPGPEAQAIVDRLHGYIREAGPDPVKLGIEDRITLSHVPPAQWTKELAAWRGMHGITHLCVHTVGLWLKTPVEHVQMLQRFKKEALA